MFCGKCGNQISDGSKFCDFCGTPIFDGVAEANQNVNLDNQVNQDPNAQYQQPYQANVQQQYQNPNAQYQQPYQANVQQQYQDPNAQYQQPYEANGVQQQYQNPNAQYQQPYEANGVQQQYQNPNAQYQQPYEANGMQQQYQQPYQAGGMQQQYQNPNMQYQQPKVGGLTKIASKLHMKPKTFIILSSILGVLIIAGIIVAANFDRITNSIKKATSTDEEYLAYAITENSSDVIEAFTALYEIGLEELNDPDLGFDLGVEFEIGDEGRELLGDVSGELDFAKKMGLSMKGGFADDMANVEGNFSINGTDIVSVKFIADILSEQVYIGMPDILKKWVMVPADGIGELSQLNQLSGNGMSFINYSMLMSMSSRYIGDPESLAVLEKAMSDMGDLLPDSKDIEKLSKKYTEIVALNLLDGVVSEDVELRAGSVSEDVTAYRINSDRVSGVNYAKVWKAVTESLMNDDEFMDAVGNMMQMSWAMSKMGRYGDGGNSDITYLMSEAARDEMIAEFKSEMQEEVDHYDRQIREREDGPYFYNPTEDTVTFYIDGKGGFRGFEIEDGRYTYFYKAPLDGSDLGVKIAEMREGEERFAIEGNGKYSSGELSGTFTIRERGERIIDIGLEDVDLGAMKKGKMEGTILLGNPGDEIADEMMRSMRGMPTAIVGKVLNYKLAIGFDISSGKAEYTVAVRGEDGDLFSIALKSATTSVGKISAPDSDDVINPNALQYASVSDVIDLKAIVKSLDKAGVPELVLSQLDQLVDQAQYMSLEEFVRYLERLF